MIVALAGGVGGAKLADGLAAVLGGDLSVVVNTGDDFEHFGLAVSPDLDTVMYTLAGIANPETGWGISGETWNFLDLGDAARRTGVVPHRRSRSGDPCVAQRAASPRRTADVDHRGSVPASRNQGAHPADE